MSNLPTEIEFNDRVPTGNSEVDRRIRILSEKANEALGQIKLYQHEAEGLWNKHAPHYTEDGERIRGGNSGGWE